VYKVLEDVSIANCLIGELALNCALVRILQGYAVYAVYAPSNNPVSVMSARALC
jgi:hypothetical protein